MHGQKYADKLFFPEKISINLNDLYLQIKKKGCQNSWYENNEKYRGIFTFKKIGIMKLKVSKKVEVHWGENNWKK
jgi:hypothetical protein